MDNHKLTLSSDNPQVEEPLHLWRDGLEGRLSIAYWPCPSLAQIATVQRICQTYNSHAKLVKALSDLLNEPAEYTRQAARAALADAEKE